MAPMAPVRATGPSATGTPKASSCVMTSLIGVSVIKQKSADPAVGTFALGSNSLPTSWRLIFTPEQQSFSALPERDDRHSQHARVEVAGRLNIGDSEDKVIDAVDAHAGSSGLTFGMSGEPKAAKQALKRPLDGGVSRLLQSENSEHAESLRCGVLAAQKTSWPQSRYLEADHDQS